MNFHKDEKCSAEQDSNLHPWHSGPSDNKLLVESYKAKRGSSADGLVVGHLARKARDAGLSPAQRYTFHLYENSLLRKYLFI